MLQNIFLFIVVFGLLIFIHELGHFVAARLLGINVEEFGFGYPPRLLKLFTWKGTEFTLNWIPFGGFNRISGENDPDVPGGMANARPITRFAILVAGPLMNLIAGILIFTFVIARQGTPDLSTVVIASVTEGSPAQAAGLQINDIIRKVNGQPIESTETLQQLVAGSEGNQLIITYQRNEALAETELTPRFNDEYQRYMIGIAMTNPSTPVPAIQAFPRAMQVAYEQAALFFKLPGMIARGEVSQEDARLLGPVSMGRLFIYAREMDSEVQASQTEPSPSQPGQAAQPPPAVYTLSLMGMLSIALAITNLLPFPALDGGRILLLLPEVITRKRVPARFENALNMVGFALLIVLMFYVTTQDFFNPIQFP
jgi:regulator of sigma E protease